MVDFSSPWLPDSSCENQFIIYISKKKNIIVLFLFFVFCFCINKITKVLFLSERSHRKRNAPYKKVNPLTGLHLVLNIFGFRHGANSLLSSPHYLRHRPITSIHVSIILPPPPLPFFPPTWDPSPFISSESLPAFPIVRSLSSPTTSEMSPFVRSRCSDGSSTRPTVPL